MSVFVYQSINIVKLKSLVMACIKAHIIKAALRRHYLGKGGLLNMTLTKIKIPKIPYIQQIVQSTVIYSILL